MKIIIIFIATLLLMVNPAFALTGDEILKKMEDAANAPKDRIIIQKMILVKADGSQKIREMKAYQKGQDKRLIVFQSPADVKGVGFLSLNDDQMYLYLPGFRKIRRIASHIKNEEFMGTDFSYEDLSETRYTEKYSATLEKEENGKYILISKPQPGVEVSYSKQKIWVDQKTFLPSKIEYYSKQGDLQKMLTGENFKQTDGYWVSMKITMRNLKNNHQTILEFNSVKHDTGLKDKFFTKRNLKKLGR